MQARAVSFSMSPIRYTSRSRSPASLRSSARTASTNSAIRRSLSSPIRIIIALTRSSTGRRHEIKRQPEDEIDRHQLEPLHPVALAVDHHDDRRHDRERDRRNLEGVEQQRHRVAQHVGIQNEGGSSYKRDLCASEY